MHRRFRLPSFCCALVLAAAMLPAPRAAGAGYAVDMVLLDRAGATPSMQRARLLLSQEAFSLDTTALRGQPSALLCCRDEAVYLLDHAAQRYQVVNMQALTGASSLMQSAGDLLNEGLGSVMGRDPSASAIAVQATERRRTIAGLPCQLYVVTRGGTRIQEVWAAPWSQVGMPRESFALIRLIAASWSGLAPALAAGSGAAQMPSIPLGGVLRIEGYPVLFTQFAEGLPRYEARFGAPVPARTRAADFAVPSTYKRTLLPGAAASP